MPTAALFSVFRRPLLIALLGGLLALASPGYGQDKLSPGEAAQQVQRQYGGQVLDIQSLQLNNRDVYRIKLLLPSKRVKVIVVDAHARPLSGRGQGKQDRR